MKTPTILMEKKTPKRGGMGGGRFEIFGERCILKISIYFFWGGITSWKSNIGVGGC